MLEPGGQFTQSEEASDLLRSTITDLVPGTH